MVTADERWTQLATRIPKDLHRRLRLHCVTHDIVVRHVAPLTIDAIRSEGKIAATFNAEHGDHGCKDRWECSCALSC
jgi:hypothetical protein